jgi:hypothetical protein
VTTPTTGANSGWALEQLTAYLFGLASAGDTNEVVLEALDRAAEAMEAEVAALILDGELISSIGFANGQAPVEIMLATVAGRHTHADLPGVGECHVSGASFESQGEYCLVVARTGEVAFSAEERNLLRGMSRALALNLQSARVLAAMHERQALMERLTRILRSINSRAPLPEVLQTIVDGAVELIGDAYAGLRRVDPLDPDYAVVLCGVESGPGPGMLVGQRSKVGQGAGGRAISEQRLVVIHDYLQATDALPVWVDAAADTARRSRQSCCRSPTMSASRSPTP